jgi:DnaK suppressor protein
VVGKPAVPGKKVIGKPAVPAKPVRTGPPRLVPATAEARAKAVKPSTGKSRLVSRTPAEVRPLGVLPPESIAKPRHAPARPAAVASRPAPPRPAAPKPALPRKGDDRLGPDDLKHFETRLLSERVRIMREMGHLESTILKVNPRDSAGELSGYSFHMADAGTDSMEREKAFDIASKEGRLLMEIDDALRRLYGGSYGICEASGRPISRARLEALPWARLSLEEQEKLEKEQRAGRLAPSTE